MLFRKLLTIATTLVMVSNVNPAFADDYNSYPSSYDSCNVCCEPCHCFEIYGDWLYWRTRRCALDFAIPSESGTQPYDGHVCEVCTGWDNGYRLGLVKPGCEYDFGIHYTHFRDNESTSKTTDAGSLSKTRLSNTLGSTSDASLRYASGQYRLDYDVIDVEVGYDLHLESCSDARLFGGFRFAEIDQIFDILYAHDPDDLSGTGSGNAVDKVRASTDIEAYGLYLGSRVGHDACWCNRTLHFYGSFSYGFLFANVDQLYAAKGTPGSNQAFSQHARLKDSCRHLLSNIDLAIGVDFNLCRICCNDWYFGIGYEFHQWFNIPDLLNLAAGNSAGEVHFDHGHDNFGLDGLYLRLGGKF